MKRWTQLGLGIAAMIYQSAQDWTPVFYLVVAMDVLTAILALFVLKPLRAGRIPSPAAIPI